jgi:hypothetical protein
MIYRALELFPTVMGRDDRITEGPILIISQTLIRKSKIIYSGRFHLIHQVFLWKMPIQMISSSEN